ncbi:prephenate dehydratase [Cryptococcus wingfieldii CBS 7118]|uniref:Prephenate dehydratase n=1 Tax=Cryptococcus wingfieldii CBS 7118 TaxID=1295528 RepID=A0A1E3JER1_9TREE|nr:prephenate dehydratase [Cryptococcus wingfieldii CBS 7118]ODN99359.1 prephenate dehydratase [Cryptococcus wingfieldii CBS 7118]
MPPPPAKRQRQHVELAFLGPRGTYGEQAARAFASRFHTPVDLVPCSTIAASIKAVYDSPSPHIVLPLENTLQGGVQETLDCLLSSLNPQASKPGAIERQIKLTLSLPIRHCLVALKGTQLSEITYVRSHEQALGQSARYLDEKLPRAKRERWSSTAGAAVSLLESPEEGEGKGAAICSKAVLGLYPDALEVLHEGTQYGDRNYTRFLLLSPPSSPLPKIIPNPRIFSDADRNHIYAIPSVNLTGFLSSVGLPASEGMGEGRYVKMIHTRPAAEGWTAGEFEEREDFPRWHLVEIDGELADDDQLDDDDSDADGEGEGGGYKLLGIVQDEIGHMELSKLL